MRFAPGLALACTTAAVLTGCAWFGERVCRAEEYPVLAVGSAGRTCVPDDQEPPPGFARYPDGKVPEKVDDEWDVYWRNRTLDEHGNIIEAPVLR
ncbi:hypothetical protein IU422_24950 [Nocardia farcinica]|nr:hypothetical protein [Nocardia farcinica]